jgi:hypothetical protein
MKKSTILVIVSWTFIWFVLSSILSSLTSPIITGFSIYVINLILFVFGVILGSIVITKKIEK